MATIALDESQCKAARVAAVLYLLIVLTAPIGLLYVPGELIVPGDATATAENIRTAEGLFRLGMASEVFHQIVGIFLVLALYRLFNPVNHWHALLMVILSLTPVPIMLLNVLNELAALALVKGAPFLSVFDTRQLDALAMLFLRLHGQGITVASIFWGLWLLPFALLVIRSRFIPRILGWLMFVAGAGYLASAAATLLLPQFARSVGEVALVLEMGELPIVFWFLIWGTRLRPSEIPRPDQVGD